MIYCDYERGLFPDSEFLHHSNGTIVQPEIHDVSPMHYATKGALVNPDPSLPLPIPGIAAVRYDKVTGVMKVAANVKISLQPDGEFMEIGPLLSSEEGIVPEQIPSYVSAAEEERKLLAIELYQKALELPTEALKELINHAKILGNP